MTPATKISEAAEAVGVCAGDGQGCLSPITTLVLPTPPSVNAMFRNVPGKGRARTKLYEDWLGHAGWRLRAQRPAKVAGPVLILVGIERTSLSADVDNRIKALFDLLVAHNVIDNDKHIVGFAAAWSPDRDRLARLAIVPAGNLTAQFHLASDGAHGGWFLQAPQSEQEPPDGY
jgi:crossover junction endodeoxyribonuclease RusA